jgi:hypothetical protein
MEKCDLCDKMVEHVNVGKKLRICDLCLLDICSAFTYYIGNKEVTKNEYDRTINKGIVED